MQATAVVKGLRLSPQQRRLWKLQQDATFDARAFGSQLVLLLEGELRTDALRDALRKVCARHESLHSSFQLLPGVLLPVQSVDDDLTPSWHAVDLNGKPYEELLA